MTNKKASADYIPSKENMDPDDLESFPDPLTNRDYRDSNYGERNHVHASFDRVAHHVEVFNGSRRVASWKGVALDAAFVTGDLDPRRVKESAVKFVLNTRVEPENADFNESVHEYLNQRLEDAQGASQEQFPLFDDDIYRVHIEEKYGPECVMKNLPVAIIAYRGPMDVDLVNKTGKLRS